MNLEKAPSAASKFSLLGQLIRSYRIQAGVDYEELSSSSGVSTRDLYEIEEGLLNPALSRLYAICNVLNIPPSEVEAIFIKLGENKSAVPKKRRNRVP